MSTASQLGKTVLYLFFKKHKLVSGILVVLIVAVGSLAFLVPKYQVIRNQGLLSSGNKKKQLTERQNYLDRLQKMVNLYRGIQKTDLDKLQQILPDSQEIPELFVMIDQIGKDLTNKGVNVTVTRISLTPQTLVSTNVNTTSGDLDQNRQGGVSGLLSPITGTNPVLATPSAVKTYQIGKITAVVDMSVNDLTYTAYKKILEGLENNMRLFNITSINYMPGAQSVSFNLETYYLSSS
ncbi:MAG: hypothetical protein WC497_00425 [Patescibacteria group bacterium]